MPIEKLTPEQIAEKYFNRMRHSDEPLYNHSEARSRCVVAIHEALAQQEQELAIPFCDSPCGHSSQYAYSDDGGKHIVCLRCELAASAARELKLMNTLREHEWWNCGSWLLCPVCRSQKPNHDSDCWFGKLLSAPSPAADVLRKHDAKRWILVSQKLPEYDVDVWLWSKEWERVYLGYWRHSEEWIGRQRPDTNETLPETNPTHWMLALPELPAQAQEQGGNDVKA